MKCILVWMFVAVSLSHAQSAAPLVPRSTTSTQYGRLPLTFEANQGQLPPQVNFISRGPGYTAFLTSDGMALSLRPKVSASSLDGATKASGHATLWFRLLGAARNQSAAGERRQPGLVNYFIGKDPSRWHRNVPTYEQVRYRNVYRGIDLIYYGNQHQLEYDFEVGPGADPRQIRFAVQGARHMKVAGDGNLLIDTAVGEVHFQPPVLYQISNGNRIPIRGGYVIDGAGTVSFQLAAYDSRQPLIIDPVLSYSTYLGGNGDEQVAGIVVDAAGSAYIVGSTDSPDFPLNTFGSTTTGDPQVFVAKLDATGSTLLFCDYLGGNSQDNGYGVSLDSANNVLITGSTASADFPLVDPFQGTYPGSYNAFLAKISSDGSTLMYSTYFGGNGADVPAAVAADANGNIVVAGYTSSTNLPLASAYQSTVSANQGGVYGNYGFVTKFSPNGSSLVYSTYLGGSSNTPLNCGGSVCWPQPFTMINGLALDKDGNTYVAGTTNTYNFPVTPGTYQSTDSTSMNGFIGFVSKIGGAGDLSYSTYFGGNQLTIIQAIAVDASGSSYVSGLALNDGTFPITTTSICDPAVYSSGCNFAFVTKFDPVGANLVYSTFLGPNNFAAPEGVALDRDNNAYILAGASSGSYTSVNGIESYGGSGDLLLVEIDATANAQLFATYLGGFGNDAPAPSGIAVDAQGDIYLSGITNSSDLPTTQSAFQTILGGNNDAFVVKIAPAQEPAVALNPTSLLYGDESVGATSQPQTVVLRNMGSAQLSISSISAVGDFTETDTCVAGVPPAGSCTLSISFAPTASGLRSGSVLITDNTSGSPHSINLSGTGVGPSASISPADLAFPAVPIGGSSQVQLLTLSNNGNAPLSISDIQISGDFSQTNNCPASLSPASACGISVTFTASAIGVRDGSVTISDDAPGSPQVPGLTGVGVDFSLSSSKTSDTVTAGASANYSMDVSPLGGPFSTPIALTCTGAPAKTTCNLSSVSIIPGSSSASVVVTVATTAPSARSAASFSSQNRSIYGFWIQLHLFGLFGVVVSGAKRGLRRSAVLVALLLIIAGLCLMNGCAGGTGIGPQGQPGTTPGTYTISVTGTSGTLHHSVPLTLTVK